jgi:hypothetical protein
MSVCAVLYIGFLLRLAGSDIVISEWTISDSVKSCQVQMCCSLFIGNKNLAKGPYVIPDELCFHQHIPIIHCEAAMFCHLSHNCQSQIVRLDEERADHHPKLQKLARENVSA